MTDLRKGAQRGSGPAGGVGEPRGNQDQDDNTGTEFGASERATRGTDRDADRSGRSKNQGHGHPRSDQKDDRA